MYDSNNRERMLANIRASLERTRAGLEAEAKRTPRMQPPFVHPAQDDLATQFVTELARLEGYPHRCADDTAAHVTIAGLLQTHRAKTVIAWDLDRIGLPGLDSTLAEQGVELLDGRIAWTGAARHERLQRLESALVCISGADIGIAESGTVVLSGGPGRGRLASLLAPVHVAVLRAAHLVRGLGEALDALKGRYGHDLFVENSSLTLITGPSRTGDIEQTLTLGVHGPREIHVVLIG